MRKAISKLNLNSRFDFGRQYRIIIARLLKIPEQQHLFLLGPRQTGKTTPVKDYLSKRGTNYQAINLAEEDKFFRYLKNPSLIGGEVQSAIKNHNVSEVFIDEVQRVSAILNEVQNLIDNTSVRFILTGSSARKLKRGSANLLGGRAVLRESLPLTCVELSENFSLEHGHHSTSTLHPTQASPEFDPKPASQQQKLLACALSVREDVSGFKPDFGLSCDPEFSGNLLRKGRI